MLPSFSYTIAIRTNTAKLKSDVAGLLLMMLLAEVCQICVIDRICFVLLDGVKHQMTNTLCGQMKSR
jgi:hypothetical protein